MAVEEVVDYWRIVTFKGSGAHRLVPIGREPGDVTLCQHSLLQGALARQVLVVGARCASTKKLPQRTSTLIVCISVNDTSQQL